MEYRNLGRIMSVLAAFLLVCGVARTAGAYPDDRIAFGLGFWGAVTGPRECDATNEDGVCIAWHSTLKGISPARWSQCTASGCDLRPDARPVRRAPAPDNSLAWQLMVVQHDICPLVMDAQAKPAKSAHQALPIDGPTGGRADHGPIVPQVIEIPPQQHSHQ